MTILKGYYSGPENPYINKQKKSAYNGNIYYDDDTQVNKNVVVSGEYKVVDYIRGRSSVQIVLENTHKEQYTMFFSDFFDWFCKDQSKVGTIKPVKRGSNIAWKPI